jgi:ribonuclease BN (tRNA processing enzyme)
MSGLSVLPLGVGDAFTALHYSTSLALQAEGAWLLIDCPHPIRKMLREASGRAGFALDADALAGVVLTHLHADHSSGLEGLGYFSYFVLHRRLALLAHPAVAKRLWEGHLAAGMEQLMPAADAAPEPHRFEDYFDHRALDEQRPVTFGPFQIECRRTIHHVPTTALRIRAGGRTLGYSADTAFDPGLIAWLAEADHIIHETNYGVHTPYARLAELPADLRARMHLVHYPDDFDLAGSAIPVLEEGRRLEV